MAVGPDGGSAEANSHSSSAAAGAVEVEGRVEINGATVWAGFGDMAPVGGFVDCWNWKGDACREA
jgi:hypothetical protein